MSEEKQGLHFSVKEAYSPNVSPDPNAFQERRSFIPSSEWDPDDFSGLQSRLSQKAQQRARIRNRLCTLAGLLVLVGVALPLVWQNSSSTLQDSIREKLPAYLWHPSSTQSTLEASTSQLQTSTSSIQVETTSVSSVILHHESDNDEEEAAPSHTAEETVPHSGYIETRPPLPSLLPASTQKYISYLPHSGYHNQRIELTNAILMGMLLNRTVLIPYARVGLAVGWKPKALLQATWDKEQKSQALVERCSRNLESLEQGQHNSVVDKDCLWFTHYAQFSWSLLVDLTKTYSTVPLVARPDLSFDWLISPKGLGLNESSIHRVSDELQYANKYYASSTPNTEETIGNYNTRIDLDDFLTEEMQAKQLIEFGSLYGSYRINLEGADPKWQKILDQIQKAMVFQLDVVEKVAEDIRVQMGGRANHLGFHLRVGDGAFQRGAIPHMRQAYLKAITSVFGFSQTRAEELLKNAEAQGPLISKRDQVVVGASVSESDWNWMEPEDSDSDTEGQEEEFDEDTLLQLSHSFNSNLISLNKRQEEITEATIQCRGSLYTAPDLKVLNAHIYIATDSRSPLSDVALAPFFRTFPCAHILDDFTDSTPSLLAMRGLRSQEEGIKLARFFTPILESIMAAGSVRVVGTYGSTFSRFVSSTLFNSYWPDTTIRRHAQQALLARLKDL